MENSPSQNPPQKTDRQLLEEIHENSRKTKNYIKWQFIITIALVVIPLIATIALIPFTINSLTSIYGSAGLDDGSAGGIQQLLQ